jgi:NAD(P)H dehydrogenase (quinone)
MGQAAATGKIVVPEDGPVSWTAHADLADAAAIALTGPGRLDGITPPLTGPEALDFADIALGQLLEREPAPFRDVLAATLAS